MSGRIGKYTYKNESVLKEFISTLFRALGSRKGKKIKKQLAQDPEMKKLLVRIDTRHKEIDSKIYFTGVPSPAAAGLTLLPVFIYLEFDSLLLKQWQVVWKE